MQPTPDAAAPGAAPAGAAAPGWDAQLGLSVAAAVVLAVLAAVALGLSDPWWAAISAWRISDAEPRAALTRGAQRVAGTLAGAASGIAVSAFAGSAVVLQVPLVFALVAGLTWLRFASAERSYFWTLGGITAVMVLVQAMTEPAGLYAFVVARVQEILCGVVVGTAALVALSGRRPAPPAPAPALGTAGLARVALLAGVAVLLVVLLWEALDLPAVVQVVVTVVAVLDRDAIRQRRRLGQRLVGCLAGAALGLAALAAAPAALVVWAAALGGGIFLFSRSALGGGPSAYVGVQGGIALISALVVGPGPPAALLPVLDRLVGITLGATLLAMLAWSLAPRAPPGAPADRAR